MNKSREVFLLLLAGVLLMGSGMAVAGEGGYLALRGAYGWSDDLDRHWAEGRKAVIQYDDIWGAGVAYGHRIDWLRIEGELSYYHLNLEDVLSSSGDALQGFGQERHYTIMANVFADWNNSTAVTPFVAGGLGAAYVNHDISYSRPRNSYTSDDHEWVFTYQLLAGVSWAIDPSWSVEAMYRYYHTESREHGQSSTNVNAVPSVDVDPQEIHFCTVGLRYSF